MNTETYQAEVAKSQQLSKFVLSLIREHYDPSSKDSFKMTCREIAEYFSKIGNNQLADYILATIGDDESCFVPM